MKRTALQTGLAALAVFLFAGGDWLQFRGSDNQSVSGEKNLPKTFREGENVAWKVALPGPGPSGPIVVAGRVVVTCASGPRQDRLHVLALDAATGKLSWERQLWATGSVVHNPFGGIASSTPASDGQRIFALFSSSDLVCFDLEGNLKWLRGLGYENPATRNDVGMASSPLVVGDTVIVQLESPAEAFAAGIDAATGEPRWRLDVDRDAAWTSPIVLRGKSREEDLALLQCRSRLVAIEPRTGKQVGAHDHWCDTVASGTTCDGTIYLPADGVRALRYNRPAGAMELCWQSPRLRTENASVVAWEGRVYTMKPPGILVCGDAANGNVLWQLRLTGPFWATPVLADGHLYAVNHAGLVQVVKLGAQGKLVGSSQIDAGILASPAVAGGAIYFRSNTHLWKIAFQGKKSE